MVRLRENVNQEERVIRTNQQELRKKTLNNMLKVLNWEHCKIGFRDKENYQQKATILLLEYRKLQKQEHSNNLLELKEKIEELKEWEEQKDLNYNLKTKERQEEQLKSIINQLF